MRILTHLLPSHFNPDLTLSSLILQIPLKMSTHLLSRVHPDLTMMTGYLLSYLTLTMTRLLRLSGHLPSHLMTRQILRRMTIMVPGSTMTCHRIIINLTCGA
jgi:hypothetical protein